MMFLGVFPIGNIAVIFNFEFCLIFSFHFFKKDDLSELRVDGGKLFKSLRYQ